MYRLGCSAGVIQRCYHAGELELFSGDFSLPVEGWDNDTCVIVQNAVKMCSQQTSAIVVLAAVTITDAIA